MALPATIGVGVLIDIDHTPDFYRRWVLDKPLRLWLAFHAYEWLPLAAAACWLSGWNPLAIGASVGFLGHLLCDQVANPVHPLTYFISYRAKVGFRGDRLVRGDENATLRWFLALPVVGKHLLSLLLWMRRVHGITRHPLAEPLQAPPGRA